MMERWSLIALLAALGLSVGVVLACDDDDDDSGDDDNNDDADDDDDDSGECTPEAFCQLSLDCSAGFGSMEECLEDSEANLQNCADAGGYTDCLCETFLEDPTCAQYLGAGIACFAQFCD
jgi:hypothetical protein